MNKKSQVLVISLWILSILTVFAVGIGHRVSMSLRLSRYQRDSLKAYYLARAGINLAIAYIEKDSATSDSLKDAWADNETIFKKISLGENAAESASVSYASLNADNQKVTVYGAEDEERKININLAPRPLLVSLLTKAGAGEPEKIADNIIAWRQVTAEPKEAKDYSLLGYACKEAPFANLEELLLVKDVDAETFDAIKNTITLWGTGKINLNTADKNTLEMLFASVVKEGRDISAMLDTLESYRKGDNPPFTSLQEANNLFSDPQEHELFQAASQFLTVTSSSFRIESRGMARSPVKRISVIYNRLQKKIVYWRQS